jgi:hypothetical protein
MLHCSHHSPNDQQAADQHDRIGEHMSLCGIVEHRRPTLGIVLPDHAAPDGRGLLDSGPLHRRLLGHVRSTVAFLTSRQLRHPRPALCKNASGMCESLHGRTNLARRRHRRRSEDFPVPPSAHTAVKVTVLRTSIAAISVLGSLSDAEKRVRFMPCRADRDPAGRVLTFQSRHRGRPQSTPRKLLIR